MQDDPTTLRHWKDKTAPPLLAILNVQRDAASQGLLVPSAKSATQRIRRQLTEYATRVFNFFLWPFDFGNVPEERPRIGDTEKELARKIQRLGLKIQETTNEYITPIHWGQLFPGSRPLGECPITIKAEEEFVNHLKRLAESYAQTRPRRRPAVTRKISHAVIAWWTILYGAVPGTKNQWTIETLSWDDVSDLYNCFCLADCREHTPDQIRKLTTRFIEEIKRTYPTPQGPPSTDYFLRGYAAQVPASLEISKPSPILPVNE